MPESSVFDPLGPKIVKKGRKTAVFGAKCSQCGCLYSDNEWDGLDICLTCGDRIRRAAGRDPQDASRFHHRLIMAARQLERKMFGTR